MPPTKIPARWIQTEINTGTDALPVWTPIGGLTSVSFDSDKTDTDTTDFDSNGYAEHMVMQRGCSISLEGFYKEDPVTGVRDAGQEALLALADAVGPDSLKPFRTTSPGGNVEVSMVSAKVNAPSGGGLNDTAGFKAELTVSGQPTRTPAA